MLYYLCLAIYFIYLRWYTWSREFSGMYNAPTLKSKLVNTMYLNMLYKSYYLSQACDISPHSCTHKECGTAFRPSIVPSIIQVSLLICINLMTPWISTLPHSIIATPAIEPVWTTHLLPKKYSYKPYFTCSSFDHCFATCWF